MKKKKATAQKKSANKYDLLVERFSTEFAAIPNFELTQTDEDAKKVFEIVTFRMVELKAYKDLVCNHFIPAANKAIFDAKQELKSSRYKSLRNINEEDLKETLYDTIRLAYVGLFHKLENYVNDVVMIQEVIFGELLGNGENVAKSAKSRFQFNIKDWQQFEITHKINWICNCVKHKDGLPTKIPKPIGLQHLDETKRLQITPAEFKEDCERLIELYPHYIATMGLVGSIMLFDDKELDVDLKEKLDTQEKNITDTINGFRNLF